MSMLSLAQGPERRVSYYSGYYINGFRFYMKRREESKQTQNSGVMVKEEHQGGDILYYGVLTGIIELCYTEGIRVVLFQCVWYDIT